MAHVDIHADIDLAEPTLVEGLPGVGLVGKIAADHLVSTFEMDYYGSVHCDGLPEVAIYRGEDSQLRPPVRLYADAERDLLVLQSDVPVSPQNAEDFANCLTSWIGDHDVTPLFVSGLPSEKETDVPELYGVSTGDGEALLDEGGIVPPAEAGMISGPTGALLYEAGRRGRTAVGLIAEADKQFPDPEAARVVLEHGVEPLTGVDAPTDDLVDQAEEIRDARERLAQRMQQAESDESSQAQPMRMFQ